jgi:tetratricopeptide (TPR) repeat protein
MRFRFLTASVVALCILFPILGLSAVGGAQEGKKLDTLFTQLKKTQDPRLAHLIQEEIWRLWMYSDEEDLNILMHQGAEALTARDFDLAMESFDAFIQLAPTRAEGWNKRATLYFQMGDFKRSIEDVKHTLALEPRHFGALSGLGLIYEALGDMPSALKAFRAALEVNPHMPNIKEKVRWILRNIEDSKI